MTKSEGNEGSRQYRKYDKDLKEEVCSIALRKWRDNERAGFSYKISLIFEIASLSGTKEIPLSV